MAVLGLSGRIDESHEMKKPVHPVIAPRGLVGDPCQILFGSNPEVRQVLMQFSVAADRLIFSPEDARAVARQLLVRADLAEGKSLA